MTTDRSEPAAPAQFCSALGELCCVGLRLLLWPILRALGTLQNSTMMTVRIGHSKAFAQVLRGELNPFVLCRFEAVKILGRRVPLYSVFNGSLVLLLMLHLYWFALICRIAFNIVTTGDGHDVRENHDDD